MTDSVQANLLQRTDLQAAAEALGRAFVALAELIAPWWFMSLVAIGLLNYRRSLYREYRRRFERPRPDEQFHR